MSERLHWWKGTRGEWWLAGQSVLMAAVVFAPSGWRWRESPGVWIVPGIMLAALGLGFAARGMLDLGPSLTPFPQPRSRAVLVRRGTFAYVRHPIYGGVIIAALGWALWRTSGLHLLLMAALAVYLDAKGRHEEILLLARYPEYAGYRARTKRLIPWIF